MTTTATQTSAAHAQPSHAPPEAQDPEHIAQTLLEAAHTAISAAQKAGAQQVDVQAGRGTEFEVKVCDSQIVHLLQATQQGLGVRVFVDHKMGFCALADLRPQSIKQAAATAVQMARCANAHSAHALAPQQDTRNSTRWFDAGFDAQLLHMTTEEKIAQAHAAEQAARAVDPKVCRFRDSGVSTATRYTLWCDSNGAQNRKCSTVLSRWCIPVACHNDERQCEYWSDSTTHSQDCQSPEHIGTTAGRRALRMLGAKPLATQTASVIFEPRLAAEFFLSLCSALDGDAVRKRASFLMDTCGQAIATSALNLTDDPTGARTLGASPFDGEGMPTRAQTLVQQGVVQTFLYDWLTARKVGTQSTHSAKRGTGSLPGIGLFGLRVSRDNDNVQNGSLADIIAQTERGLVLTQALGRGFNMISGDYSRGASGLWVENGQVVHPVQEMTIGGDALTMLRCIDAIGDDIQSYGAHASPTLRIKQMRLGGK